MLLINFFAFSLDVDPLVVTGVTLWALTLYLSFAGVRQKTIEALVRWFNVAERSLHLSKEAVEKNQLAREPQHEFWASILSIVPFLICGALCYYGIVIGLGQSWAISVGMMGVITSGIYELARSSSNL